MQTSVLGASLLGVLQSADLTTTSAQVGALELLSVTHERVDAAQTPMIGIDSGPSFSEDE